MLELQWLQVCLSGDYNKAIKALLNKKIYGTQNTEAEYEQERIDFLEQNILKTDMTGSLNAVARNIATHIHKIQSGQYEGTVDQNGDPIEFSTVKTFFKDGDISKQGTKEDGTMLYELTENGLSKWNAYEGLVVYDYRTGKLFKKQGNNFIEVIIGEETNRGVKMPFGFDPRKLIQEDKENKKIDTEGTVWKQAQIDQEALEIANNLKTKK